MERKHAEVGMRNVIAALIVATFTVGCAEETSHSAKQEATLHKPDFDEATLALGRDLYTRNCAQCHGPNGEGAANWTQRNEDGTFPAPPLNGTGHTWHHPEAALISTIKNGTQRIGGSMPAWRDKLTEKDIKAILAWAQSQWPDELYAAWYRMNQEAIDKSKQQKGGQQ